MTVGDYHEGTKSTKGNPELGFFVNFVPSW
jgi:hypothetical protein